MKTSTKILTISGILALIPTILIFAGSLFPSADPDPTGYTLNDVYNLIVNNSISTLANHSLSTSTSPTATTSHSTSEIYALLANLIQRENIQTGLTYLGTTGDFNNSDTNRSNTSIIHSSLTSTQELSPIGYSLEDINNLIVNNSTTTAGNHSFSTSSSPSSSMHSITDIYNALSNLIDPATVKIGVIYLGKIGAASTMLTISSPSLTLSKSYDASTTAAVTAGTLSGVVGSDDISVSAVATYDNINVGTGKTITTVYTLGGVNAGNYTKPISYSTTTGAITNPIPLTISTPSLTLSKSYDASTTAAVAPGNLSGVLAGDTVTVSAISTYDNINIGTGKTIMTVYTLAGEQAGNYTKPINYSTSTGVITALPLTTISAITGTTQVGSVLTAGVLTPSGATVTYQWRSATTPGGTYSDISGATASTYTLAADDLYKYIKVVATATGNYSGTATSTATAIILGNITFTYNGGSVTYGMVYNVTTSKVWLDRNLGATQVAQSSTDSLAYGDLFQWGRPADGHQLINRTGRYPVNGTQTPAVATTTPGTITFIIPSADWSSIDSDGVIRSAYLSKTDGTGICPTGFRVPTLAELNAERLSWSSYNSAGAFASPLKLIRAGTRNYTNGSLINVGVEGCNWSSTGNSTYSQHLDFDNGSANTVGGEPANGFSVRCIKD